MEIYETLSDVGNYKINNFQKNIVEECLIKGSGGLSLPMGSGKTLISIVLSLIQISKLDKKDRKPILVICSKTLIGSWINEIGKFFGDMIHYEVLQRDFLKKPNEWKLNPKTTLVLTTSDFLSKYYKEYDLSSKIIEKGYLLPLDTNPFQPIINFYQIPSKPLLCLPISAGHVYSVKWGTLLVDEVQGYTNITTPKCQSIIAINSHHRWLLSGTMFNEPKVERILGYYMLLHDIKVPNNLPTMDKYIKNVDYEGLRKTTVERLTNENFDKPEINEEIISHSMTTEEEKIYLVTKELLKQMNNRMHEAQLLGNNNDVKKFASYRMVILMYLRQSLICPLIPISSITIDVCDSSKKSEVSTIFLDELNKLEINNWLNDTNSVKSSRISSIINTINKHKKERLICFSCFASCLDILSLYLPNNRPIFRLSANLDITQRNKVIEDFSNAENSVLIITYALGAEGLNLQSASTILLIDFWWNAAKVQQAIARVFRWGQTASKLHIYYFTSNTGIENILFKKQHAKIIMLDELKNGCLKTSIPNMKIDNIIRFIDMNDNKQILDNINFC